MYIIMWEFRVKRTHAAEFEQAYGPQGTWVALFQDGEGFLGTELFRDRAHPQRYVTIDRWTSRTAYEGFRRQWAAEYEALDERCAALTEMEASLGSFGAVSAGP